MNLDCAHRVQVLVQAYLLLASDLTGDSIIGDNPPAVNGNSGVNSAYPVPVNAEAAVNLTVVFTDKPASKVRAHPAAEPFLAVHHINYLVCLKLACMLFYLPATCRFVSCD